MPPPAVRSLEGAGLMCLMSLGSRSAASLPVVAGAGGSPSAGATDTRIGPVEAVRYMLASGSK